MTYKEAKEKLEQNKGLIGKINAKGFQITTLLIVPAEENARNGSGCNLNENGKQIHTGKEVLKMTKSENQSADYHGEPDALNRICILFGYDILNDASEDAFLSDTNADNAKHAECDHVPRLPACLGISQILTE